MLSSEQSAQWCLVSPRQNFATDGLDRQSFDGGVNVDYVRATQVVGVRQYTVMMTVYSPPGRTLRVRELIISSRSALLSGCMMMITDR